MTERERERGRGILSRKGDFHSLSLSLLLLTQFKRRRRRRRSFIVCVFQPKMKKTLPLPAPSRSPARSLAPALQQQSSFPPKRGTRVCVRRRQTRMNAARLALPSLSLQHPRGDGGGGGASLQDIYFDQNRLLLLPPLFLPFVVCAHFSVLCGVS